MGPCISDIRFFKVVSWFFHGFWLVPMVFQGGFMVFHGFWLVPMVFQGDFMVFHGFEMVSMVSLQNVPPQTVSWPNNPV